MATDTDNTAAAAREALQARILVELMGNALAKELVLKGGLAMRLAHTAASGTRRTSTSMRILRFRSSGSRASCAARSPAPSHRA
jgi:hypothetical protein